MKRITIVLLLFALIFSSCTVNKPRKTSSAFSKRKHLNGFHFRGFKSKPKVKMSDRASNASTSINKELKQPTAKVRTEEDTIKRIELKCLNVPSKNPVRNVVQRIEFIRSQHKINDNRIEVRGSIQTDVGLDEKIKAYKKSKTRARINEEFAAALAINSFGPFIGALFLAMITIELLALGLFTLVLIALSVFLFIKKHKRLKEAAILEKELKREMPPSEFEELKKEERKKDAIQGGKIAGLSIGMHATLLLIGFVILIMVL